MFPSVYTIYMDEILGGIVIIVVVDINFDGCLGFNHQQK